MNWIKIKIDKYKANKNNNSVMDQLKSKILKEKKIVILTGAGISKEAGIETFREGGIYDKNPELYYKLRPETYETDPDFLYNYYNNRLEQYKDKLPTKAHEAIAQHQIPVITQNVDDLHEKAGSHKIIHVHGKINSSKCRTCKTEFDKYFQNGDLCDLCQGKLRHNIILFKEALTKNDEAIRLVLDSEVFIQIGSSGVIYPVAGYVSQFHRMDKTKEKISICVDISPPENVKDFTYFLQGKSSDIVPDLLKIIFS